MPKVVGASKVTTKFQITIPQKVREALKVKVGDTAVFVEEDGKFYIATSIHPTR